MSRSYRPLAFTPAVIDSQIDYGSRAAHERLDRNGSAPDQAPAPLDDVRDALTEDEREFVAGVDGFYLASVSQTGWPYVQFRGGPPGFVTTPDQHTIAWPDFRGNRQYISTGNVSQDSRVAMIFMDYARQTRLKVFGHATVVDLRTTEPGAISAAVGTYRAKVEREVRIDVSAYDWNCPQHITPRYSAAQLEPVLAPLRERLAELEAENAELRAALDTGAAAGRPSPEGIRNPPPGDRNASRR